jgi:hypothetical protein
MSKWINVSASLIACLFISSLATAEDTSIQYQQRKLPDGSTEMHYQSSDGAKMHQIQRPDGTIETHTIDADGTESTVKHHPNGNVEFKTKEKGN